MQPAGDPGAGLVEMGDRRRAQLRAHLLREPTQPRRALGEHRGQRAGRHARAEHLREQLTGPLHRQVLPGQQVAAQRADPRPVTRRRARLVGEARGGHHPTPAPAPFGPMLGCARPHLGQVDDLTGLHPDDRRERQLRAAPLAPLGDVDDDLVGVGHLDQVRARRAGLLARLAATTTPLPPWRGRLAQLSAAMRTSP